MRHLIITSVLCTTHLYSSTLTREEVHDLYASTNIIPVNKSRRILRSTYGEEERYVKGLGGDTRGKETAWNKQV